MHTVAFDSISITYDCFIRWLLLKVPVERLVSDSDSKADLIPEPVYRSKVLELSDLKARFEEREKEINKLRSERSKWKKANPNVESTQGNGSQPPPDKEPPGPEIKTPLPTGDELTPPQTSGKRHEKSWHPAYCPTCKDDADAKYEGWKDETKCANCGQHTGPKEWLPEGVTSRCLICGSKDKAIPVEASIPNIERKNNTRWDQPLRV